jgi:hypothetical protein
MNIEIRKNIGPLSEEVWRFHVFESGEIFLSDYYLLTKESKRRKFNVKERYHRIDQRGNTLKAEDVPWPDGIEDEVKQKLLSMVTVIKKRST